jgi:hypothetical protein
VNTVVHLTLHDPVHPKQFQQQDFWIREDCIA